MPLYGHLSRLSLSRITPHLFMYFGFTRYHHWNLFDADWSIFVEEVFYVTLPFLFFRVSNPRKALTFILAVAYGIKLGWLFFGFSRVDTFGENFILSFPLNHWPCFAFGIALYWWKEKLLASGVFTRSTQRTALEVSGLALVALALFHWEWLIPPALALFILLAMSEKTWIGQLTRTRWLGLFGRCCYSIYLLHLLVLSLLDPIKIQYLNYLELDRSEIGLALLFWFPIAALVNLGVGTVTYYAIERPWMSAARAFTHALRGNSLATVNGSA